jgi:hypothetical protein
MNTLSIRNLLLILISIFQANTASAQQDYFFKNTGSFDAKIPTPEQFLGYPIGSHYTRHDQLIAYLKELEKVSNKVHVQTIGKTYEERPQVIVTITSPENYARLEQIRQEHVTLADPTKPLVSKDAPSVVWLAYSVHGNETSSGEAGLLTAYYLAANQSEETAKFLKEAVIFIDPSSNPDGRDRAANWHNSYKSIPPVADPLDKEHIEGWPNGRSNHYLANLNRDWLSATQIESKNRLQFYHQWYPNVYIDFHEMGSNSTYYFEPTPANHQSPIIPQSSYDFNATLAKYHVEALDQIGSLYFTKEQFDNLSPIYGSTYPDFFGAVGVTFEQGSSRGLVQETENGLLTFAATIRNHLRTGIATVRGAIAEKEGLFKLQKDFFKSALTQAKSNPNKAFVFGDSRDQSLTNHLLELLLLHRIKVYHVANDLTLNGKKFTKGTAYIVPAEQPNYRLVHSIFEETPKLDDSVYYDNTSWSIIHAYGLQHARLTDSKFTTGSEVTAAPKSKGEVIGDKSEYAYLINWSEYNASKALYYLLSKNVLIKAAFKPFTANTATGKQAFGYGSIVVPVATQTLTSDALNKIVKEAAALAGINIATVKSGFNAEGIDLGSNNIRGIKKPEVALIVGTGTNYEEVGQVWFLLNQHLNLPVTKLDISSLSRAPLNRYNTLIFVSGNYNTVDKNTVSRIKNWVTEGGNLITFKNAADWAIHQELTKEKLLVDSSDKKAPIERVDYVTRTEGEASKRINGGLFLADIDITNPLAFGLNDRKIYFTKNSTTILAPSKSNYATVAKYLTAPYVGGYVSKQNINKIANTAAILVSQEGAGKVVLFADDPSYRSYWHGTDRLLLNAIFFSNQIQLQQAVAAGAEEE